VRIKRSDAALLVIDVQEKIIGTIAEHAQVVQNIQALIEASEILGVPVLSTEQEKLGGTVPTLATLLHDPPLRKVSFSCCDSDELMRKLIASRRKVILVCGIETHICVLQTVLDLLQKTFCVHVVKDATSSHKIVDRDTAFERMMTSGATFTSTEAAIYELTERAGTDEFGKILNIVKDRRRLMTERSSS
jgi:nicotinamidase-related amidase